MKKHITFFLLTAIAALTAMGLSSRLALAEPGLQSDEETVVDSTASQYLSDNFICHKTTETIEEAISSLASGQADAIVFDAPILQYLAVTEAKGEMQVVGSVLQPEYYGIAMFLESPHRKVVNKALLDAQQNGAQAEIHEKWFGE